MPSPDHTAAAADPALLRIKGPIATITLNRPAAFNSIDLSIAQKLEQLGAEVEQNDAIRVLVIEGEGRAFSAGGDLQTIGAAAAADSIAPVVGELLKHYHAFIETVRRMPKIVLSSVNGSAAGAGMGLAFVTDLCIAATTPAHPGLRRDRRVAGRRQHGRHGRDGRYPPRPAAVSGGRQLYRAAGLRVGPAGAGGAGGGPEGRDAKVRLAVGGIIRRPPSPAPNRRSTRPRSRRPRQQLDAEEAGIIKAMHTDDFRVAVKKFTSKGK